MYEYRKLMNHLEKEVLKIMDGKATESEMEIRIVVEGTYYLVPLNADTYTSLIDMLSTELKAEEEEQNENIHSDL